MDRTPGDFARLRKRKRGLALGAAGFSLLFAPAIAFRFTPPEYLPALLAAMVVGIVLLLVGFVTLPGSLKEILRPKP